MPVAPRRTAATVLSGAHSASAKRAPLLYDIRKQALNSASLWQKFFRSTCDEETETFLEESQAAISYWRDAFASFLLYFVSRTDANAIAGRGELFVFSQAQALQLLGYDPFAPPPSSLGSVLLDVGAGNGAVTARLAPFFERVVATEFSGPMVRCLRARGFEAVQSGELSASVLNCASFDVIMCLNVLDRADKPLDLLRTLATLLRKPASRSSSGKRNDNESSSDAAADDDKEDDDDDDADKEDDDGGRLILAVVLPWCPFVEDGTKKVPPTQRVSMSGGGACGERGSTFESAVRTLDEQVLTPEGWEVERWTRVPYLSQGDANAPYYVLTDALLVLKRRVVGGEEEKTESDSTVAASDAELLAEGALANEDAAMLTVD